jgi:hypothetical protein
MSFTTWAHDSTSINRYVDAVVNQIIYNQKNSQKKYIVEQNNFLEISLEHQRYFASEYINGGTNLILSNNLPNILHNFNTTYDPNNLQIYVFAGRYFMGYNYNYTGKDGTSIISAIRENTTGSDNFFKKVQSTKKEVNNKSSVLGISDRLRNKLKEQTLTNNLPKEILFLELTQSYNLQGGKGNLTTNYGVKVIKNISIDAYFIQTREGILQYITHIPFSVGLGENPTEEEVSSEINKLSQQAIDYFLQSKNDDILKYLTGRERLYAYFLKKENFDYTKVIGFDEWKPDGFMYNWNATYNIEVERKIKGNDAIEGFIKKKGMYLLDLNIPTGRALWYKTDFTGEVNVLKPWSVIRPSGSPWVWDDPNKKETIYMMNQYLNRDKSTVKYNSIKLLEISFSIKNSLKDVYPDLSNKFRIKINEYLQALSRLNGDLLPPKQDYFITPSLNPWVTLKNAVEEITKQYVDYAQQNEMVLLYFDLLNLVEEANIYVDLDNSIKDLNNTRFESIAARLEEDEITKLSKIILKNTDSFLDVIIHADENNNYYAYIEDATGTPKRIDLAFNDVVNIIKKASYANNKLIRLLSCSNLANAKEISALIPNRIFVATEDLVRLHIDGGVTTIARSGNATQRWRKLKNGIDEGDVPDDWIKPPSEEAKNNYIILGDVKYSYQQVDNLSLGALIGKIGNYEIYEQGEVFYRAMNEKHYKRLEKGEGVVGTGETFTSPTLEYIKNGTKTGDGYSGIIVKFKVKRGTLEELKAKAVREGNDSGNLLKNIFGETLPPTSVSGWNIKYAKFKIESYPTSNGRVSQVNIGLGNLSPYSDVKSALDIFNQNILEYQIVN